jgi:hypothetical protein
MKSFTEKSAFKISFALRYNTYLFARDVAKTMNWNRKRAENIKP